MDEPGRSHPGFLLPVLGGLGQNADMPSPKLIQILRSRSDLTDAQIIDLTDDQAWAIVYELDAKEKEKRDAERKPTVCFTGFNKGDKAAMEDGSTKVGLKPVQNVSNSLEYLVLGETPGQSKIAKAEEAGVKILHAHEFEQLFLGNAN
jgi:NAD-dependent DNA ligase